MRTLSHLVRLVISRGSCVCSTLYLWTFARIIHTDNEEDSQIQDPPVGRLELLGPVFRHNRVLNDVLVRRHPESSQTKVQQAADTQLHRLRG